MADQAWKLTLPLDAQKVMGMSEKFGRKKNLHLTSVCTDTPRALQRVQGHDTGHIGKCKNNP